MKPAGEKTEVYREEKYRRLEALGGRREEPGEVGEERKGRRQEGGGDKQAQSVSVCWTCGW